MASEQSIRITARGEFSQLENGLKNLQKDLKSVLGEIDKGARKGGFFDDTQLRALDVYRTRFKSTMDELNREFQKQNDTIDQLYKRQQNSSKDMQKQIQEEINKREKLLDKLRRQMIATEDLYGKRNKEASGYGRPEGGVGAPTSRENDAEEEGTFSRTGGYQGGSGGSLGSAIAGGAGGMMSRIMKLGGFVLGMAGVGGIASTAMDAYRLAFNSQVTPMNLSQRIRGQGYNGSAKNMWDEIGSIGRSSGMGYTSEESWNFQDMLSRQAGTQSPLDLRNGLMFGRGYGLETGETAQGLGSIRALGGASSITQIANMVASSVAQSGMTPRILEVMQTSAGLLASMNTTLKDNGVKQILAYQTTLDTIGNQKGMMQLTGAQGANIIQGLGGIYNPSQSNPWSWMGIQALQQYNPQKYGKMGLYDLQTNFEDGLQNTDNLPAMVQYLRKESGGNTDTLKRMIQQWLQQGGYNATKQQVNDLYGATNGFSAFDSSKINGIISKNDAGDGTAKYQERMGQLGQQILDTNANFEKDLENLGQPILSMAQTLKAGITDALNQLVGDQSSSNGLLSNISETLKSILSKLDWKTVGEAVAAALVAKKLFGGGGSGGGGGGGSKLPAIIGGGKNLVKGALGADAIISPLLSLWQTFNDPNDQKNQDAMAKKAGMTNKSTTSDRFFVNMAHDLTLGLLPKQSIWDALNVKKQADKLDSWFQKMFPDTRSSDEKAYDKKVLQGNMTKDGKNRYLTFPDYLDPSNWGKKTTDPKEQNFWQGLWKSIKGDDPANDQELIKAGIVKPNQKYYDDQNAKKAFSDLQTMSNDGRLYLENMSKYGQEQLQKLSDQGLIKMKDGFDTEVTTLSGFTDSGKKSLLDMQKQGLIFLGGMTSDGTAKITAFSSEGQKKLEALKSSGQIDISNFHTESSKQITSLTTDGLQHLLDLQKNGSLSMDSMNEGTLKDIDALKKDSGDKMNDILAEHKDFNTKTTGKDGLFTKWTSDAKGILSGFFDWWKSILPSWLGGGSSSSSSSASKTSVKSGSFIGSNIAGLKNYRADMNSNVSASTINKMLAGTSLAGHGQDFIDVGTKTGVDPAFLVAQAYAEQSFKNPKGSNNLFGLTNGLGFQSGYTTANDGQKLAIFPSIKAGIEAAATNLQGKNYLGKGNDTVEGISKTWVGTPYWGQEANNIYYMLNKLGAGSNATSYGGNGSSSIMNSAAAAGFGIGDTSIGSWGSNMPAFANWQNNVLSPFGDMTGRTTPHTGLDIAEKAGTPLQALAGGKLSFLYMDDGSKYDTDGKANTREGGTEMGIKMPNGQTYFYSHLSNINPDLLKQWEGGNHNIDISKGEYLANSGGVVGAPGSGYGSEGQHLHLGYLDSKGHYLDPAQLLNDYASNTPAVQQTSGGVTQIEVTVKFEGQGASELNGLTQNALRKLIQQGIRAYEAQKISLNPSM